MIASEGWAEEDPDIVAALLDQARHLATLVIADAQVSAEIRSVAEDLLERLKSDTFGSA